MNPYVVLTRAEYEGLEKLVTELHVVKDGADMTDTVMSQLDKILQTVLFSAAIEGGLYYDGESSFLYEIVRHSDILAEFNKQIGAALRKPVTWDGLILLPSPGKRQMLEALRAEEDNALATLFDLLNSYPISVWQTIQDKMLNIAETFANIDVEQKGEHVAENEIEVSKKELGRLSKTWQDRLAAMK